MQKHPLNFHSAHCHQHALMLSAAPAARSPSRRLLLLHGAGVAGEVTWTYVANYLTEWDEILIPDLAGMGRSAFMQPGQPQLDDYVRQIDELMTALDWQTFDVAGYSFGGLVAERWLRQRDFRGLCFLLEPAMLFSSSSAQILAKAATYRDIADHLQAAPDDAGAYRTFLDSVSPYRDRNERAEALTLQRLQQNATGFIQALRAVSQALEQDQAHYRQWTAPWPGASFVGELSLPDMHERHQRLARESRSWQYHVVAGADHSLVYTRPRAIAAVFNEVSRQQRG